MSSQLAQTPTKLRAEITRLERQLSDLKDELDAFEGLHPYQKLATVLHEMRCKEQHGTGPGHCGWYVSTWQPGRTGGRDVWHQRAKQMFASGATYEQILNVVTEVP